MIDLMRALTDHRAFGRRLSSFVPALMVAEMFFKFHSFTIECMLFLATWLAFDVAAEWFLGPIDLRATDPDSAGPVARSQPITEEQSCKDHQIRNAVPIACRQGDGHFNESSRIETREGWENSQRLEVARQRPARRLPPSDPGKNSPRDKRNLTFEDPATPLWYSGVPAPWLSPRGER